MTFNKQPLNVQEMIARLKDHNMIIHDNEDAELVLEQINYYRLSTYWFPFKLDDPTAPDGYRYRDGTLFDEIVTIYEFDSDLRNILAQAIEKFEVVLRREVSSVLSIKYGPFPHINPLNFRSLSKWQKTLHSLLHAFNQSKEEYVNHYKQKYPELELPPIWVVAEISNFGYLVKTIENLAKPEDRKAIANRFFVEEGVFCSSINHLNLLRNFTAHHARIWNRKFFFKMQIPRKLKNLAADRYIFNRKQPDKIYNSLVILDYYLTCIGDGFNLMGRVDALLAKYDFIDRAHMGYPIFSVESPKPEST